MEKVGISTTHKANTMIKIYGLTTPEGEIRYIGVTRSTLNQRLSQHICAAKTHTKRHVCNWINKLLTLGLKPEIILLDEVDNTEWEFWEIYYIQLFKNWGFKLTNTSKGGAGVVTAEMRSKDSMQRSIEGHKKPIYQLNEVFEPIARWDSQQDAKRALNIKSTSNIGNAIRFKIKCKGFYWCKVEDLHTFKQDKLKN